MKNLLRAITYLEEVIDLRLASYFQEEEQEIVQLPSFSFEEEEDYFTQFVTQSELSIEEYIVLLLCLVPHIEPTFLERKVQQFLPNGGNFSAFGGRKNSNSRYIIPTIGTAIFILSGTDLQRRMELLDLFDSDSPLVRENVVQITPAQTGEPLFSATLQLEAEYVELFLKGRISVPTFSTAFPAELLTSEMDWSDLILNNSTKNQLREIEIWLKHQDTLMNEWGMSKKISSGYRALFYGPPGTGKTLASTLIGAATDTPVFRIDLSKIVSKYIGETEKNLSYLFDKAEHKGWCLFFDEADACFGKRSTTKDSKDRYANQEISYLLQRIENYSGLVIMATNFKSNIDSAFLRRFQSVIYFPVPKADERLQIWQNAFPPITILDQQISLEQVANDYELTGSSIMNVAQYACLQALDKKSTQIQSDFIVRGIKRELAKEGRRA